MMQNEFESLTGKKVTPEEYAEIEKVYMATDYDKVQFCKLWNESKSRELVLHLAGRVAKLERQYESQTKVVTKTQEFAEKAALRVMDEFKQGALVEFSDESRQVCAGILGMRRYCKELMKRGIALTEDEQDYLISIL